MRRRRLPEFERDEILDDLKNQITDLEVALGEKEYELHCMEQELDALRFTMQEIANVAVDKVGRK